MVKKLQNVDLTLAIDGINITQVESVKLLGLMVDEHLNWRSHIANIEKKLPIGIVSKVGSERFGAAVLAQDVLAQIYTDKYTLYTALSVGVHVRTSRFACLYIYMHVCRANEYTEICTF